MAQKFKKTVATLKTLTAYDAWRRVVGSPGKLVEFSGAQVKGAVQGAKAATLQNKTIKEGENVDREGIKRLKQTSWVLLGLIAFSGVNAYLTEDIFTVVINLTMMVTFSILIALIQVTIRNVRAKPVSPQEEQKGQ